MKAAIYARCSTDEKRQDVEVQLTELRRYCESNGWGYEEFSEYDSGYKGEQAVLKTLLGRVHKQEFQVLVVYSLDRFSRQTPSKMSAMLDSLVEQDRCRFISRLEGLDSQNDLIWHTARHFFSYFAHLYSRNLSAKIRAGIATKRASGSYLGGRPSKRLDLARLEELRGQGLGWRSLTKSYNEGLPKREQVSMSAIRRACQKQAAQTELAEVVKP